MEKWYEPSEADWILLNNRLILWQEKRTEMLLKEYDGILKEDKPSTQRFRELKSRIDDDRKMVSVETELSRERILETVISLITEGSITAADLEDFSKDLRETVAFILERMGYGRKEEEDSDTQEKTETENTAENN